MLRVAPEAPFAAPTPHEQATAPLAREQTPCGEDAGRAIRIRQLRAPIPVRINATFSFAADSSNGGRPRVLGNTRRKRFSVASRFQKGHFGVTPPRSFQLTVFMSITREEMGAHGVGGGDEICAYPFIVDCCKCPAIVGLNHTCMCLAVKSCLYI